MIPFSAPLFNIRLVLIYIHIKSETCAGLNLIDHATDKNYFLLVIVILSSLIEVFSPSETWSGDSLLIPHVQLYTPHWLYTMDMGQ